MRPARPDKVHTSRSDRPPRRRPVRQDTGGSEVVWLLTGHSASNNHLRNTASGTRSEIQIFIAILRRY